MLLQVLVKLDLSYKDKVYYLTANTSDALRGSPQLQTLIDVDSFRKDHIIEKGSPREKLIRDILSDMRAFEIQNSYRTQCDILRKHLEEDSVNQFITIVKHYKKDYRRGFVFELRNLLENLLKKVAHSLGKYDADYWEHETQKNQLRVSKLIYHGLSDYDKNKNIGYNAVIQNACFSIHKISSECIHSISRSVDIENINTHILTHYTMNTLINQICDVILWFGSFMDGQTSEG